MKMKRTLAYNETPRFNGYHKLRHAERLSKHELCPDTPELVRKEVAA